MGKSILGCLAFVVVLLLVGVIVAALSGIGIYNGMVSSKTTVDQRWADVESSYQRRADLIPNLVKTVSGAANFEKSTLVEITQARASVGKVTITPGTAPTNQGDLDKFQHAQDGLSSAISRLLVVSERYPDLKANENFQQLQAQLEGTENRINVARNDFNSSVQDYNSRIQRFPGVFLAPMAGFKARPYFQAAAGSDTAPKVDFNFGTPAPVATPAPAQP